MTYAVNVPGEGEFLHFVEIHQSASQVARAAYQEKYGVDYHDDPEWKIGGERHAFWLDAWEKRQASLILNPNQA